MRRTLITLLAAGLTATAASGALAQDFGASIAFGPQGVVGASLVTGYSQTYATGHGHPQPYAAPPAYYPPNHPGPHYPPVTYRPPVYAGHLYVAPVHAAPVYQPRPHHYRPAPVVVVPAYGHYGYRYHRHHRHHGGHPHHGWR